VHMQVSKILFIVCMEISAPTIPKIDFVIKKISRDSDLHILNILKRTVTVLSILPALITVPKSS
jgi:hypothetical protein